MEDDHQFDALDVEAYDPNDPKNEPRPDHVVYQQPFQNLKAQTERAVGLLRDTLVGSAYQSDATRALLEEVKKRGKLDVPERTMFAVCGDMGLGKSSLINSLLSAGTIARNGSSGDSCTWVVQRFMKPFEDQMLPFAAKVSLFAPHEIRKIIASLVTKYINATERMNQEDEEAESDEMASDNFTEKRTVLDIFKALFADREEFSDDDAAQEYLNDASCENELTVDELVDWAMELREDCLEGKATITFEASTISELLYALQPFTYQLGGGESEGQIAPWPLVNVVDFGLDNILLQKGIVLVDTPGLSDSDSTRAKNALSHHRQCTHKITVADVARAKNDKALRENLVQGYRLRGSAGTLLVLTKGDHIDGDTELSGDRSQKEREFELKNEVKTLREARTALSRRHRTLRTREEKFDLEDQLRDNSSKLKLKISEYDHLRACMRNDAVTKTVSDQYREMTGDPQPLSVFVVGNDAYKKHQAGHTAEEKPILSVQETGIPDLRAHLYVVPAEGELNSAMHLVNVQLPSLLNHLELYCSKTHMTRKKEIEAIVLQPTKELRAMLEEVKSKLLRSTVQDLVLRPMNQMEPEWVKGAAMLCNKWAENHQRGEDLHIMKRQGNRKGRKKHPSKPDVSWNKELLQIPSIKEDMEHAFRELQKELLPVHEELNDVLVGVLESTRAKVQGDPQFNVMAVQPFLKTFEMQKANMDNRLKNAFRALREETTTIQEDAMMGSAHAYIHPVMEPIYAHAITIKGRRGAPKKRMDFFRKKVAAMSGVWMGVHDEIESAFSHAVATYTRNVERGMRDIFDAIHRDFNMLCENAAIKDPDEKLQEQKFRAKLQTQLMEARELLDGPIREAVNECRGYGKERNSLFVSED